MRKLFVFDQHIFKRKRSKRWKIIQKKRNSSSRNIMSENKFYRMDNERRKIPNGLCVCVCVCGMRIQVNEIYLCECVLFQTLDDTGATHTHTFTKRRTNANRMARNERSGKNCLQTIYRIEYKICFVDGLRNGNNSTEIYLCSVAAIVSSPNISAHPKTKCKIILSLPIHIEKCIFSLVAHARKINM